MKLKPITAFSSNTIALLTFSTSSNVGEKSDGGIHEQYSKDTLEASMNDNSWNLNVSRINRDLRNNQPNPNQPGVSNSNWCPPPPLSDLALQKPPNKTSPICSYTQDGMTDMLDASGYDRPWSLNDWQINRDPRPNQPKPNQPGVSNSNWCPSPPLSDLALQKPSEVPPPNKTSPICSYTQDGMTDMLDASGYDRPWSLNDWQINRDPRPNQGRHNQPDVSNSPPLKRKRY